MHNYVSINARLFAIMRSNNFDGNSALKFHHSVRINERKSLVVEERGIALLLYCDYLTVLVAFSLAFLQVSSALFRNRRSKGRAMKDY